MTDLEYIKNMLDKKDINYTLLNNTVEERDSFIIIERGSPDMKTYISFDKYGNFKDIGAYE
jgi:hypothetical protein